MRRILIGIAAGVLMLSVSTAKAAEWPSIVEAKDIAEEGFIYGLPIVMNYAVMYAYAVNKDSRLTLPVWPAKRRPSHVSRISANLPNRPSLWTQLANKAPFGSMASFRRFWELLAASCNDRSE